MAYGLKFYFEDKKIVTSTTYTYRFEILQDGYSGSSTEWTGVNIQRNYDQSSLRQINFIQKSSCTGNVRVEDATQRTAIEAIAGSEIGDYKVQLKRNGSVIWTGLVVPDLINISEENFGNQSATIVAKDIFITGDFALSTSTDKAINIIIDILNTMGYQLDVYTFSSWVETTQSSSSDIFSVAYHEKRRIRRFGKTDDEEDQPISNEEALKWMLKTYGAVLRQADGAWNIIQISAFEEPSAVRRFQYDYTKTLQSSELDYQLGATTITHGSGDLRLFGSSSNTYLAGLKKVKSEFVHESVIQGIKFNRQYWFENTNALVKSQFWQADGTGNLELSFNTWLARDSAVQLGNPIVAKVTIQCGTYYFNGTTWTTTASSIDVEVEEIYSTTDSNGYYIHKNNGIDIVTDNIPNGADGTLTITIDPEDLTIGYQYLLIRDVNFHLAYSDQAEGVSESIRHELVSDLNFSAEYDFGKYYFGAGPTSASLSAIKASNNNLLATFKRGNEGVGVGSDTHEEMLLREILDIRRTQKKSIRAILYGEYEPVNVIQYDGSKYFFFGGSWDSKSYQWNANLGEYDLERPSDVSASDDVLNTFYVTNGEGYSSAVSGSTGTSTGSGSIYLEKSKNLNDLGSKSQARINLGVQIGSDVQAYDADLSAIAGLANTDGNFIVGNGSTWVAESGATVRTSLGLGTLNNVQFNNVKTDLVQGVAQVGSFLDLVNGDNSVNLVSVNDMEFIIDSNGGQTGDFFRWSKDANNEADSTTLMTLGDSGDLYVLGGLQVAGISTGTETTGLFIDNFGTVTKRSLGAMAFEDTASFDNYSSWRVQESESGAGITFLDIESTKSLSFAGSGDVSVALTNDGSGNGTMTITGSFTHPDTSSLNGTTGGNDNGVVIEDITVDSNGHVTAIGTRDLDGRYDNYGGWLLIDGNNASNQYTIQNTSSTSSITFTGSGDIDVTTTNVGGAITVDIDFTETSGSDNYIDSVSFDTSAFTFSASYNTGSSIPDITGVSWSHNHNSLYYTETEIGNFFSGSTAISGYNKSNWDTAYGWGDHDGVYLPLSGGTLTGNLTVGNGTADMTVRTYHSDASYTELKGYGVQFNRATSYIRPTVTATKELLVGSSTLKWQAIKFDADAVQFNDGGTLLMNLDGNGDFNITNDLNVGIDLGVGGNITATGTLSASGYNKSNWDSAYNKYVSAISFATGTGVLTLTKNDTSTITVDLDGRYLTSYSETDTLASVTGRGATTSTSTTFSGGLVASGGISGLTLTNGISGSNFNISGVNQLSIADPGEGIVFGGGSSGNITLAVVDDANDNILRVSGTGATLQVGTNRVLTTADEGNGNGLDADTLDGQHASAFLTSVPSEYLTQTEGDGRYLQLSGGTMTGTLEMLGVTYHRVSASDNAYQRSDARDDATNYARLHWYGVTDTGGTSNFRHAWYDGGNYINVTANSSGRIDFTGSASTMYIGSDRVFDDGYHPNADKLTTARSISLTGAVTGSTTFDGSGNVSISTTATSDPTLTLSGDATGSATFTNLGNATLSVTVVDDSHNHIIGNVDGLQTALDGRLSLSGGTLTGDLTIGNNSTDRNLRVYHSDNAYTELRGYGIFFSRGSSYIRPTTDNNKNLYIGTDGNQYLYLGFDSTTYNLASNGTSRLHINSSGNVGIGTTSPVANAKLTNMGNISLGIAGNGSNTSGRFISIEGNTDASGEGSGRIFFAEHNSSTSAMSNYGMSIGYRGGGTSIVGADGNTWTGLASIANGEWGMWGHNNNATGALIMHGDRGATFVNMSTRLGINRDPDSSFKLDVNGAGRFANDLYANEDLVVANNIYLTDTNTAITEGSNNAIRHQTNNGWVDIGAQNSLHAHIYTDMPSFYFNKTLLYASGNKIWHAGNDGSGSTLDADLLDGQHGSAYQRQINESIVDITNPDLSNGTWSTADNNDWGTPRIGSYNARYNDGTGWIQWDIPSGMDTCYISQLQWSSGGYVDVYGVQSDGGLVFLRRINTRQSVENTNEGSGGGNPNQHDGSTITLAGTGLSTFTSIRFQNRSGRFHLTGMSFTSSLLNGAEGTGMVHPAQLSVSGSGSSLDADLLDGQHGSYYTNAGNLTGTIPDVFSNTTRYNIGYIDGVSQNSRDKLRVWGSGSYTIGMKPGYSYGHLGGTSSTDYAMSFQMNNNNNRGFWWGDDNHLDAQGAMSLTTQGKLTVATSISVGEGETITAPSSNTLYVNGESSFNGVVNLLSVANDTNTTSALFINQGQDIVYRTLGSNAFNSTSYLPLAGGTMTGELDITRSVDTFISLTRSGVREWRHNVGSNGHYYIRNQTGTYNVINISDDNNVGLGTEPNASNALHVKHPTSDAPLRVESGDAFTGITFQDTSSENHLFYKGSENHFYFNGSGVTLGVGVNSITTTNLSLDVENKVRASGIMFGTDTADANTLDDYEEGTFTPTIHAGASNIVLATNNYGKYTRIGNVVHCSGRFQTTSLTPGSSSINVELGGLPFTASTPLGSGTGAIGGIIGFASGFSGEAPTSMQIRDNESNAYLYYQNASLSFSNLKGNDFSSGANTIVFQITYHVA